MGIQVAALSIMLFSVHEGHVYISLRQIGSSTPPHSLVRPMICTHPHNKEIACPLFGYAVVVVSLVTFIEATTFHLYSSRTSNAGEGDIVNRGKSYRPNEEDGEAIRSTIIMQDDRHPEIFFILIFCFVLFYIISVFRSIKFIRLYEQPWNISWYPSFPSSFPEPQNHMLKNTYEGTRLSHLEPA
jgi:hypothetical protein